MVSMHLTLLRCQGAAVGVPRSGSIGSGYPAHKTLCM